MNKARVFFEQSTGEKSHDYVKDFIISETVDNHQIRLREAICYVWAASFKIESYNCHFLKTETRFLEENITAEGLLPKTDDVRKFHEWTTP